MVKISELKTNNIHQIRLCFYDGQIWTKNALAKTTGLSLAATTNILQLLLKADEIKLVGEAKSTGGRKSKQYVLNHDYYHLGKVILKRDGQDYCFILKSCDLLGHVSYKKGVVSKIGDIDELSAAVNDLITNDEKVAVLALSVPGVCKDGKVGICDFEALAGCELTKILVAQFKVDVVIENDVNVASIGFGKQHDQASNLALLYQPRVKYVGCGIIIEHRLCRGYSNFAGELSYLPFFTHLQQEKMLRDDPHELLLKQLVTICCVIDPEVVGVCSDVFEIFDEQKLSDYLPLEHLPKVVNIDDLNQLIDDGLYSLGIEVLKNKMKKRDD